MNNNSNEKTNVLAIIGFILSFFVAIVGLILSILGLRESSKTNRGKGLSIAGIIISCIQIIISIISFLATTMIPLFLNVNSDVEERLQQEYCPLSYRCVYNNDDTYTCKFINDNGQEKEIVCDKKYID